MDTMGCICEDSTNLVQTKQTLWRWPGSLWIDWLNFGLDPRIVAFILCTRRMDVIFCRRPEDGSPHLVLKISSWRQPTSVEGLMMGDSILSRWPPYSGLHLVQVTVSGGACLSLVCSFYVPWKYLDACPSGRVYISFLFIYNEYTGPRWGDLNTPDVFHCRKWISRILRFNAAAARETVWCSSGHTCTTSGTIAP